MGLKWVNLYRLSYSGFPRAVMGNGCRSSSSENPQGNIETTYGYICQGKKTKKGVCEKYEELFPLYTSEGWSVCVCESVVQYQYVGDVSQAG